MATGRRVDLYETFQILKNSDGIFWRREIRSGTRRRRQAFSGRHLAGGKAFGLQSRKWISSKVWSELSNGIEVVN